MTAPLIDPFLRPIRYLRVSVTDRCDFRCVYCMAEHMSFLPKRELLTLEELDRLCSAFVGLGVRKLRVTGGEPLVRRDILTFFRAMGRHLASGALDELTLTTNGSQLDRFAGDLAAAGVRRVNVSLDTLDPEKFAAITRWGRLDQVMRAKTFDDLVPITSDLVPLAAAPIQPAAARPSPSDLPGTTFQVDTSRDSGSDQLIAVFGGLHRP